MIRNYSCSRMILLALYLIVVTALPAVGDKNYVIGSGDIFSILVYDNSDLSTKAQVDGDGHIRFPLLGEVKAGGLTVARLSELIEDKLADGYIINPQVSITISEYRSKKVSILGQVKEPALYELRGRTTLLELISTAEGLTDDVGRYAYISRNVSSSQDEDESKIKVDLKRLVEEGDISQNILIQDGDSVFISKMEKVYVTGEVKRSGGYRYEHNLTVIRAITNAGGMTDKASATNIKIIRQQNEVKTVLEKVNMDALVRPEDVIVVPESFF